MQISIYRSVQFTKVLNISDDDAVSSITTALMYTSIWQLLLRKPVSAPCINTVNDLCFIQCVHAMITVYISAVSICCFLLL